MRELFHCSLVFTDFGTSVPFQTELVKYQIEDSCFAEFLGRNRCNVSIRPRMVKISIAGVSAP